MALGEEMSVFPGTIRDKQKGACLTRRSGEMHMPGNKPCPPGCDCHLHNRPKMTPEEVRVRSAENMRRWRAENPERDRENWHRHQATPGFREKAQVRERRRQPMRRIAAYGLTPERFMEIWDEQNGGCYLCDEPLNPEAKRGMHIDHDHDCCRGATSCGDCVRGFACMLCNNGIGAFGDDPDRMERAAARLRSAKAAVVARKATKPVQAELFDLNEAARRREESA